MGLLLDRTQVGIAGFIGIVLGPRTVERLIDVADQALDGAGS